jgi:hypothetical protein
MIRQDYILRLIEQFIKVLAKVLFDKRTGNYNSALDSIDRAMDVIVGLDNYFVKKFTAEDIKALLSKSNSDSGLYLKYIFAARLIKERTDVLILQNGAEYSGIQDYQKALSLYLDGIINIDKDEVDTSVYIKEIKELQMLLKDNLTPELTEKLKQINI